MYTISLQYYFVCTLYKSMHSGHEFNLMTFIINVNRIPNCMTASIVGVAGTLIQIQYLKAHACMQ